MRSCVLLALALGACSSSHEYKVHFAPLVGGQPFSCTQSYPGIGTSSSTIAPLDFRVYVSGVTLLRASGDRVPLALDEDGKWQHDDVGYLDFEDDTGTCDTGSPATNFDLVGHAPEHADYTGLEFTVGIPADQDHLDVVTAAPPLDDPDMFWSWMGGYRYFKLDVQTTANPEFFFHVGAEQCSGHDSTGYSCNFLNLATISLPGFQAGKSEVSFDLATLFADSDLDAQEPVSDPVVGCMSSTADPECPPLYGKLGMGFEGAPSPGPQTLFKVAQ